MSLKRIIKKGHILMDKLDYIYKTETVSEELVDRCPHCKTLFKKGKPILPSRYVNVELQRLILHLYVRLLVDLPEDELKEVCNKGTDLI